MVSRLLPGLNDSEEYVICKTLDTLASLTTVGLLSKHLALKLLDEAIPLLQHPCKWIRFVSALGMLNFLDLPLQRKARLLL